MELLRIFISASPDLRSYRQVVREALHKQGIIAVSQEELATGRESVSEILERTIAACDAVIVLVGFAYGAEPPSNARSDGQPRRSYWQFEVETAKRLGKPIYIFVAHDQSIVGRLNNQSHEKEAMVAAFRRSLLHSGDLYHPFSSKHELEYQILAIGLRTQAKHERKRSGFKIFISYRKKDLAALSVAARLYESLVEAFGDDNIFMDIQKIPLGQDFRRIIAEEVARANVMFAIIGPTWAKSLKARRHDPDDYLRLELESAIDLSVPIVPIFLGDLAMPNPDRMPESVSSVAYNHGFRIDVGRAFYDDVQRLVADLKGHYLE